MNDKIVSLAEKMHKDIRKLLSELEEEASKYDISLLQVKDGLNGVFLSFYVGNVAEMITPPLEEGTYNSLRDMLIDQVNEVLEYMYEENKPEMKRQND